ncbi:HAD-IA family hydrolase [Methylomonas methanica]|nr:HAD-IA family hydrolase [Methylomonas methanica]
MSRCLAGFLRFAAKTRPALRLSGTKNLHFANAPFPRFSADEFADSFIAEWGLRLAPRAFLKAFTSWPRQFFPGARKTIRDLRANYMVGCLSNSNPLHWQRFGELEDDFDITLFSHLLGAIKPDPEIFVLALGKCDVEPSEVYFFDDCSANVHSAQSLGITAFHVDGFESLQDVLNIQGLMP